MIESSGVVSFGEAVKRWIRAELARRVRVNGPGQVGRGEDE